MTEFIVYLKGTRGRGEARKIPIIEKIEAEGRHEAPLPADLCLDPTYSRTCSVHQGDRQILIDKSWENSDFRPKVGSKIHYFNEP